MAKGPASPVAPFDERVDPADNRAYTYADLFAHYRTFHSEDEIVHYWNTTMTRASPHSVGKFRVKATATSRATTTTQESGATSSAEPLWFPPDDLRLDPWMLPVT